MTRFTPYQWFKAASDRALLDRHEAMKIQRCRDCGTVLNAEEIEAMPDKSLAFGQCSACRIIATEFHPCGNCTTASVGPGRTLCGACLEKMKG